jgi:hypothetical protein
MISSQNLTQLPRVPTTNRTTNPKPETLNPTQELLNKRLSANLRAESWKRASEASEKKAQRKSAS